MNNIQKGEYFVIEHWKCKHRKEQILLLQIYKYMQLLSETKFNDQILLNYVLPYFD